MQGVNRGVGRVSLACLGPWKQLLRFHCGLSKGEKPGEANQACVSV